MFSDSSNSPGANGVTIWVAHYNDVNRTTHNDCIKLSRHVNSTLERKNLWRRKSWLACINSSEDVMEHTKQCIVWNALVIGEWLKAANDLHHGWIIFCCLSCAYLRHVHPIQLVYRSETCQIAIRRYPNRRTMDFRRCCRLLQMGCVQMLHSHRPE